MSPNFQLIARSAITVGLGLCLVLAPTARAEVRQGPRYHSRIDASEARESLAQILENLRLREERGIHLNPDELRGWSNFTLKLLRTFRDRGAPGMTIDGAPFPGLLVSSVIPDLYPIIYDSTYASEYQETVVKLDSVRIFDAFMSAVSSGEIPSGLPEDIEKAARMIGGCLAKKALAGAARACELDTSERVNRHGFVELFLQKVDCKLANFYKPCRVRRTLFDVAKPLIEKAKDDPALNLRAVIEREFVKAFPAGFRKQFLTDLGKRAGNYPALVIQKFEGEPGEFWEDETPLIDWHSSSKNQVRTSGFAAGLSTDIGMSALLLSATDPYPDAKMRGRSAALFYAAANRLLVMTGGQEARLAKKGGFELVTGDTFDPSEPKRPPRFASRPFGGWSLDLTRSGPAFQAWDWSSYDPMPPARSLRLFPVGFGISRNGRAIAELDKELSPVETLSDLGDLLGGLASFLRLTRSDSTFGPYFGSNEDLARLLEPSSPIVFPKSGRLLALGMIQGIAKNLTLEQYGHLSTVGAQVSFHDRVAFTREGMTRTNSPASVRSVSRLMIAASDLMQAIHMDRDFPAETAALEKALANAAQIGIFVLGAQGQDDNGRFAEAMGAQGTDPRRRISTQIMATRALTRVYGALGIPALLVRLELAWKGLDGYWVGSADGVPMPVFDMSEPRGNAKLEPSMLWSILNLWEDTQREIRPALGNRIDWDKWETRMDALRKLLLDQLATQRGPEEVKVSGISN